MYRARRRGVSSARGLLSWAGRSAEVRTTTGLVSVFHIASLGLIIIGSQLMAIRRPSALPSPSR